MSGVDGRYSFTSLRPTTYDITAELSGFRTSQRKGVLLQANQNLTVNFAIEVGNLSETVTVSGESPTVDVTVVGPQRSRRSETHRRTAAERPRRRQAEHAGRRHGADRGRSGIREDDSRRAAAVDQRHRGAAGVVPAGRHEPHRPVLPAEPAVPVPRRAAGVQHSDQQLQRGAGQQRRRGRQRRHAIGDQRLPRRRVRLPARSARSTRGTSSRRRKTSSSAGSTAASSAVRFSTTRRSSSSAGRTRDLQNVGTTKTATVPTAEQRAGNFGSTAVRDPLTGPAVPQQSDSGVAVRSGVGERAEIHADSGRRRPHPDPAHDRTAGQSARHEGRSPAQPERPAERAVLLRQLPQRSDLHRRQPAQLQQSDAGRRHAHAEHRRRLDENILERRC